MIAYHIARERVKTSTVEEAVANAMKKIVGAYCLVIMSPRKMIGARDPFGFKPLCIGKRDNAYIPVSYTHLEVKQMKEEVRQTYLSQPERGNFPFRNLSAKEFLRESQEQEKEGKQEEKKSEIEIRKGVK